MRPMTLNERAMASLLRSLTGANCNRLRVGGIRDARRRIRALDDEAIDEETAAFLLEAFPRARAILESQANDGVDRRPPIERPLSAKSAHCLRMATLEPLSDEWRRMWADGAKQFTFDRMMQRFEWLARRGYIAYTVSPRLGTITDKGRTALARAG